MVNSLQLRELRVQNTTVVYPWFLESIFNEFISAHSTVNKSTSVTTMTKIALPRNKIYCGMARYHQVLI